MTEAAKRTSSPADVVFAYHTRSKHRLERYAAGPETLDWTEQPNPFREFAGSPRMLLPLHSRQIDLAFAQLHGAEHIAPRALSLESVGALLELSLGVSAWKEYGPDRWALRCNPSSGNLHPTEAYVLCDRVPGLDDGVYHYVSRDHALEQRCVLDQAADRRSDSALWVGLSSVHWREAWKYGERAFRYCQIDIGHAIGALRYAAAVLGWSLRVVESCDGVQLAGLLGLDRNEDFGAAEREEPDLLLAVIPDPAPCRSRREAAARTLPAVAQSNWRGRANVLDPHPMYHWPAIDEIAAATVAGLRRKSTKAEIGYRPYPHLTPAGTAAAVDVIRNRRSAQQFDRKFTLQAGSFFHLLDCLLTRQSLPWDAWPYTSRIHPLMFVHRVEGLAPGLYALPRRPDAQHSLRNLLRKDFLWRRVESAPRHLPLFQLFLGDVRQMAKTLSCHQAIASDSSFSLAMLAEFGQLVAQEPWRYRQLHWEAGLLGQVLYLEAEAMGLRGTGIGCYFDDALHDALGLHDQRYQSLYHFTVGRALLDGRISTLPPYPGRAGLSAGLPPESMEHGS
jgi:SagB-type dehydrogenase family enzyme